MSVIEQIEEIWRDTLDMEDDEKISHEKTFFEMGGNSLTAMIVLDEIKETFSLQIEVNELYQNDTIEKVAELVEKKLTEVQ